MGGWGARSGGSGGRSEDGSILSGTAGETGRRNRTASIYIGGGRGASVNEVST